MPLFLYPQPTFLNIKLLFVAISVYAARDVFTLHPICDTMNSGAEDYYEANFDISFLSDGGSIIFAVTDD